MRKCLPLLLTALIACDQASDLDADGVGETELELASNVSFPAATFGMVKITAGGTLVCSGTLIGTTNLVLTAAGCVNGRSASSLRAAVGAQSSSVRLFNVAPDGRVAVLLLRGSLSLATPRPVTANVPAANARILCMGYDSAGTNRGANFQATARAATGDFTLASSGGTFGTFTATDLGGSCQADANSAEPLAFVVTGVGTPPVAVSRASLGTWIDDMLRVGRLADVGIPIKIESLNTDDLCMDIAWGDYVSGRPINQFGCHTGANQQWVLDQFDSRDLSWVRFVSVATGMCMTVESNLLVQRRCNGAGSQNFHIEYQQDATEGNILRPGSDFMKAIDVPGFSHSSGTQLQAYSLNFGINQRWWLWPQF